MTATNKENKWITWRTIYRCVGVELFFSSFVSGLHGESSRLCETNDETQICVKLRFRHRLSSRLFLPVSSSHHY
jgi:hypothetical protein